MDFILNGIECVFFIYEDVFWFKEIITTLQSFLVFLLFWLFLGSEYRAELILYLSSCIGVACIFLGDMGYWSDNDVLKLIAPALLVLLVYNKNHESDILLFLFIIPYFITTLEFFSGFSIVIRSLTSHLFILLGIITVRRNFYLSLLMSTIIGVLINLIGSNFPPGTNDILVNPILITIAVKGLGHYTKDLSYIHFLKLYWTTLLCFAYFGSWIFEGAKQFHEKYL